MLVDIAVIGATGYTGQLVIQYLSKAKRRDGKELVVAACGRDSAKIANVLQGVKGESTTVFKERVVDVQNAGQLDAITKDASVVIACAGPFAKYGMPVVESCVTNTTNYVDITGEPNFVMEVARRYHEVAEEKKLCIVPCCGFDSIPSDMSTFFAAKYAKERLGRELSSMKNTFVLTGGEMGLSTGTIRSGIAAFQSGEDIGDVYLLNPTNDPAKPPGTHPANFEKPFMFIGHDPVTGFWNFPFIMAGINTRIVRRSCGLFRCWKEKKGYADTFTYNEVAGTTGLLSALAGFVQIGLFLVLYIPFIANFVLSRLKDREGPPTDVPMKAVVAGEASLDDGGVLRTKLTLGAGYPETAVSVSECALILLERSENVHGGVLTPATAFGDELIPRLAQSGWSFEVEDTKLGKSQ